VLIGDKDSDIEAGRAAGVGRLIRLGPDPSAFEASSQGGLLTLGDLEAARTWLNTHYERLVRA
jgi:phosphoglycolate phosphatase-like HAD superfamily hydrolase